MNKKYDLMISMFGGLSIRKNGSKQRIKWIRKLSKNIFCYLLCEREKKFSIDELVEIFFPGEGKFSLIKKRVYQGITTLKKALNQFDKRDGSIIDYKEGGYSINENYILWLDIEEFINLVKQGEMLEKEGKKEIAKLRYSEALSLYKGGLLPEIEDIWIIAKREFYKKIYYKLKEKLKIN
jgi:two-component SAPR family response regulator